MLTIRQRGSRGTWYVRGTVRAGKDIRKIDEHSTGTSRRHAAEEYRSKLEADTRAEILHGTACRIRRMTCAEAMLEYTKRPGGLHPNDAWRCAELGEVLGEHAVADVLQGWKRFVVVRCEGLAPATVNRFRDTLQAALNYAAEHDGYSAPRLPKLRVQNTLVRWLPEDLAERLMLSYAHHVQPIILMLRFQGCRTQEALQLQWKDVDLERGTVWFGHTKTGVPRSVSLHRRVVQALSGLASGCGRPAVFIGAHGRPYADTRSYRLPGGNPLRQAHATACRRAGVTDFRVHDWRHNWAAHMVMAGVDLPTIQRLGGWQSLRMLERYSAVSTEHMAEAMRRVG